MPRAPTKKKGKDGREWTTTEQKNHLLARRSAYTQAQATKTLRYWLSVELEIYFQTFPTQPVTVEEGIKHGWTEQKKRLHEENVSVQGHENLVELTMHFFTASENLVQESYSTFGIEAEREASPHQVQD
jgi:hypothetical protein